MIALCEKLGMEVYVPKVSNHYTGIILSYMEEVVRLELVYNQKYKILSHIIKNEEFIKDLKNYRCPSNFYKLIKVICFTKNEILLTRIIVAKNRFTILPSEGWITMRTSSSIKNITTSVIN